MVVDSAVDRNLILEAFMVIGSVQGRGWVGAGPSRKVTCTQFFHSNMHDSNTHDSNMIWKGGWGVLPRCFDPQGLHRNIIDPTGIDP